MYIAGSFWDSIQFRMPCQYTFTAMLTRFPENTPAMKRMMEIREGILKVKGEEMDGIIEVALIARRSHPVGSRELK